MASLFTGPATASAQQLDLEPGVSWTLATKRKATISNVVYDLEMNLTKTGPIDSKLAIRFELSETLPQIVLDFNAAARNIRTVKLIGENDTPLESEYEVKLAHIVVKSSELKQGQKYQIKIEFTAGEQSLNRNEKFLYTLLVPDRASTVFPCFDQPDMKARFDLSLGLPKDWIASANGEAIEVGQGNQDQARHSIQFATTKPISTYLFSFAAGEFQKVTREIDGRTMTMLHRESDADKVARNLDAIFKTHAFSLEWLEDYTGINYPFQKFDFVLIPSFQYGGMEHIGNIFYNADQLFLDESATTDQKLNRASLIAHETAHMWFGNLVTMKWFDDVWLKEVFANFMAAKIVHPSFPTINHNLGFLLKHHPNAYGEDRTRGSYPIQQKLDNLRNAGTLYGRIIYQKAPVVMRQLETMIGQTTLQEGLQEYLKKFSYDNAVWDDLIDILDSKSEIDLKTWSEAWVKEPGTPQIESSLTKGAAEFIELKQVRMTPGERFWSQQIDLKVFFNNEVVFDQRIMINGASTKLSLPPTVTEYDFYLVNSSELGYGYFRLDDKSRSYLLGHVHEIKDEVTRGAAWLALYESLIRSFDAPPGIRERYVSPTQMMTSLIRGVECEDEPLNRQNILRQLETVFWKFLPEPERQQVAPEIESALWKWLDEESDAVTTDARSAYYKALVNVATTEATVQRLADIWQDQSELNGLKLSEADFTSLAAQLVLRRPEQFEAITTEQLKRIENEDRLKRFQFVIPSLSPNQETRDQFFESLQDKSNRRPERWTLEALDHLHHPMRASLSEKYILPSLELLEEIQLTGDIFFPKRWLVSTFSGHRSQSAAQIVTQFLKERPDYSPRLKNKILQAADLLLKVGQ